MTIKGTRVYERWPLDPGEYSQRGDAWFVIAPEYGFPIMRLDSINVIQNEDNTITVTVPIKIVGFDGKVWEGFLEKGIWRSK